MISQIVQNEAKELVRVYKEQKLRIATAESCTGGLVSAAITTVPGSSEVFDRAFITYSNDAKNELVNVKTNDILKYGAVSKEVAIAMAQGAIKNSNADIAIAITGVAGPGGGTELKPVGLVHFSCATKVGLSIEQKFIFPGDRMEIRQKSVRKAIEMLTRYLPRAS